MLHVYRCASIRMKADILGVPDVPSLHSFATSGKLAMHSLQIQEHRSRAKKMTSMTSISSISFSHIEVIFTSSSNQPQLLPIGIFHGPLDLDDSLSLISRDSTVQGMSKWATAMAMAPAKWCDWSATIPSADVNHVNLWRKNCKMPLLCFMLLPTQQGPKNHTMLVGMKKDYKGTIRPITRIAFA